MTGILVVRNDKLGDFILALPAIKTLKLSLPQTKIAVLVPEYTAPVARACGYIDQVIIDRPEDGALALARNLRRHKFSATICLYSSAREASALFLSRIKQRYAPASRIFQFFYTHRLTQRRSRSIKPEYEYNLDLVKYFITGRRGKVKQDWRPALKLAPLARFDKKTVIIHPGSGGSAGNLNPAQYAELAAKLHERDKDLKIVFSIGPGENHSNLKPAVPHEIFHSTEGLIYFGQIIQSAVVFISGSTGVLHLAAALDMNTVGFYPCKRRSASKLRWKTLNQNALALEVEGFDAPSCADKICSYLGPGFPPARE